MRFFFKLTKFIHVFVQKNFNPTHRLATRLVKYGQSYNRKLRQLIYIFFFSRTDKFNCFFCVTVLFFFLRTIVKSAWTILSHHSHKNFCFKVYKKVFLELRIYFYFNHRGNLMHIILNNKKKGLIFLPLLILNKVSRVLNF
jgi:hypothetical protein